MIKHIVLLLVVLLTGCAAHQDYSKIKYSQPRDPIYFNKQSNFNPGCELVLRNVTLKPYNPEISTDDNKVYDVEVAELKDKKIPKSIKATGFFLNETKRDQKFYIDLEIKGDIFDGRKKIKQAVGIGLFGPFAVLVQDNLNYQGTVTIVDDKDELVARYSGKLVQYPDGWSSESGIYSDQLIKETFEMISQMISQPLN